MQLPTWRFHRWFSKQNEAVRQLVFLSVMIPLLSLHLIAWFFGFAMVTLFLIIAVAVDRWNWVKNGHK